MPHGTFGLQARALVADIRAKRHSLKLAGDLAAGEEEAVPEAVGNLGGGAAVDTDPLLGFVAAFFAGATVTTK